jgi:8-oxo-dGTP pyrophosphatase MutT (NUDIX family)
VFAERPLRELDGRGAAVAIVICETDGDQGVLLTRRAARLRSHAGQYAFPGGRLDDGENAVEGALRELREEIGLELSAGDVVGRLPDYRTRSGFRITPIVVWASDVADLQPDPSEVEEVFHVPLATLSGPGVPRLLERDSGKPIIQMPVGNQLLIHAPTGAILHQFAEAAVAGRYVDAQSFEEPVWARS